MTKKRFMYIMLIFVAVCIGMMFSGNKCYATWTKELSLEYDGEVKNKVNEIWELEKYFPKEISYLGYTKQLGMQYGVGNQPIVGLKVSQYHKYQYSYIKRNEINLVMTEKEAKELEESKFFGNNELISVELIKENYVYQGTMNTPFNDQNLYKITFKTREKYYTDWTTNRKEAYVSKQPNVCTKIVTKKTKYVYTLELLTATETEELKRKNGLIDDVEIEEQYSPEPDSEDKEEPVMYTYNDNGWTSSVDDADILKEPSSDNGYTFQDNSGSYDATYEEEIYQPINVRVGEDSINISPAAYKKYINDVAEAYGFGTLLYSDEDAQREMQNYSIQQTIINIVYNTDAWNYSYEDFTKDAYYNILQRTQDPEEVDSNGYWTWVNSLSGFYDSELDKAKENLIISFINSDEFTNDIVSHYEEIVAEEANPYTTYTSKITGETYQDFKERKWEQGEDWLADNGDAKVWFAKNLYKSCYGKDLASGKEEQIKEMTIQEIAIDILAPYIYPYGYYDSIDLLYIQLFGREFDANKGDSSYYENELANFGRSYVIADIINYNDEFKNNTLPKYKNVEIKSYLIPNETYYDMKQDLEAENFVTSDGEKIIVSDEAKVLYARDLYRRVRNQEMDSSLEDTVKNLSVSQITIEIIMPAVWYGSWEDFDTITFYGILGRKGSYEVNKKRLGYGWSKSKVISSFLNQKEVANNFRTYNKQASGELPMTTDSSNSDLQMPQKVNIETDETMFNLYVSKLVERVFKDGTIDNINQYYYTADSHDIYEVTKNIIFSEKSISENKINEMSNVEYIQFLYKVIYNADVNSDDERVVKNVKALDQNIYSREDKIIAILSTDVFQATFKDYANLSIILKQESNIEYQPGQIGVFYQNGKAIPVYNKLKGDIINDDGINVQDLLALQIIIQARSEAIDSQLYEELVPALDIDGNGIVDTDDIAVLATYIGLGSQGLKDYNGDGIIDINDAIEHRNQELKRRDISKKDWNTDNVQIVKDSNNVPVPVPNGYTASKVSGENTIDSGFVIYEGTEEVTNSNSSEARTTRNQYVWVPVYDINDIYGVDKDGKIHGKLYTYDSNGRKPLNWTEDENKVMTITDTAEQTEPRVVTSDADNNITIDEINAQYEEILSSIKQYGGFYIGRYETGDLSKDNAKVVSGNKDISSENWYLAYEKCKKLQGNNNNVKTSLMWGSLHFETLQWLVDLDKLTYSDLGYDSTSWGNYKDSQFNYYDGERKIKGYGESVIIPTGSSFNTTQKNQIYDLAGNVAEFLMTSKSDTLKTRIGGNNKSSGVANTSISASEMDNINPTTSYENSGCRAVLYIIPSQQ